MKRLLLLPFILLLTFVSAQEYWMQDGSVTTCSGMFYDSGGPAGLFSNNENYTFTICPDRTGDPELATVITFVGNLLMEPTAGFDYITIYDGDDTTAPVIGTWQGGQQPGGADGVQASDIGINPSGCLTVVFISDPAGPGPGWEAEISCQVPCQTINLSGTTTSPAITDGTVTIVEGETIEFFGDAVFSQDDTNAVYEWDFGDGTTSGNLNDSHTYAEAGTYTVTLTVSDDSGNPDCAQQFTFLVVVTYDSDVPCPAVEGIDPVNNSSDVLINCSYPLDNNGCMVLYADYVPIKETSSYIVESIPFQPPYPVDEGAGLTMINDDFYGPLVNFPAADGDIPPYRFCFFGEEKEALVVGANGRINFDTSYALDYDNYTVPSTLPTNIDHMMNTINGAYHDMQIEYIQSLGGHLPDEGAQFSYGFQGDYPCRMFVVNYNNIPLYACDDLRTTQQIVLWEGSNYIDIYLHNKPDCDFTEDLVGLQGPTQNQYAVAPGRNTSDWSAQEEAWRFIPDGPELPVDIQWFDSDGNYVGSGQTLDICPTEDTYYTVQVTYSLCGADDVVVTDTVNVTYDINEPQIDDITEEKCDVDGDGEVEWDLYTITANSVTEGLQIQGFFTSLRGADELSPDDRIDNPAEYVSGNTTVYVNVINNENGCTTVFEVNLEILDELELEPLTESQCLAPGEDEVSFNLNEFNDHFLNGEFYDIFYYLDEADAIAGEDNYLSSDDILSYSISETTILYVRVQTSEGCFGVVSLTLEIATGIDEYVFDAPIEFCDSPILGEEIVDLTAYESDIANGETNLTFFYYEQVDDATSQETANAIADPTQYNLTSGVTEIYISVSIEGGCNTVITMPVLLGDGLTLVSQAIELCDINNDNVESFDLTTVTSDIIANADDYTFAYYSSEDDANNNNNPITSDIADYESSPTQIWVLVEDSAGCSSITFIDLILNETPVIEAAELSTCIDSEGNLVYNLEDAVSQLLADASGYTLHYYNNQDDANQNNTDQAIENIGDYTGADQEVVYVHVTDGTCSAVGQITLSQLPQPVATPPDNIVACDFDNSGDNEIDLTTFESDIIGAQTGIDVSYHTSQDDADNNVNAIANPTTFLVQEGTITIYVRVGNDDCYDTTSFDVTLNSLTLENQEIIMCDIGDDGTEDFDLTLMNDEIAGGVAGYDFEYYTSYDDALNNVNPITSDVTAFASSGQVIYVVATNAEDCSAVAELNLQLELLPSVNTDLSYPLCDPEFDGIYGFELTDLDSIVVSSPTSYTITYYSSLQDAENQTNPLTQTDADNIRSVPMMVYVRVEKVGAEPSCVNYTEVTLEEAEQTSVNQNLDPLESCDDGFGTATFELTPLADIVTSENSDHWVSYHHSLEDAQNDLNPINPDNAVLSDGTLYVRVHAQGKCPSITEIDVVINPQPLAEIFAPTNTACLTDSIQISAANYDPTLTYEWRTSTGETLGTDETLQVMGEDGDQSIMLLVTDPNTTCYAETSFEFDAVDIPMITSLETTNNSITAIASGQGPFEYSLDGINWQITNTFENLPAGMYDVYVRSSAGGCEGIGMSTLVLNVSNVITPNDDGLNDYFVIPFMDAFRDEAGNVQASQFYVYDRYGKLLLSDESSNDKTEFVWDGKFNGRPLNSGDYWYLLVLADGRKANGHITVKNK